jgi:hypothetical protein
LLVAVLGAISLDQAQELARLHLATTTAVGVMLDVSSWTVLPPRAREEAVTAFDRSATFLSRSGWRIVRVGAGQSLPHLWPQAAWHLRDVRFATTGKPADAAESGHALAATGGSPERGR